MLGIVLLVRQNLTRINDANSRLGAGEFKPRIWIDRHQNGLYDVSNSQDVWKLLMRFHWDRIKAAENQRKHRVAFEEACTIFSDASILTVHDEKHSWQEDRGASMGMSITGRILVVIHSWPEPDESGEEVVRIISARRANEHEQVTYLERKR
ncbi:MAG: BrnT family toxin [Tepidisphaeraceae bacterium]